MVQLCSHGQIIARDTDLKVLFIFSWGGGGGGGGGGGRFFTKSLTYCIVSKDLKMVFSFFPFSAFISFQLFEARVTRLHSTVSIRALMYLPFKILSKNFFSFGYSVRRGWGRARQKVGFRTATQKTSPRIAIKNEKKYSIWNWAGEKSLFFNLLLAVHSNYGILSHNRVTT